MDGLLNLFISICGWIIVNTIQMYQVNVRIRLTFDVYQGLFTIDTADYEIIISFFYACKDNNSFVIDLLTLLYRTFLGYLFSLYYISENSYFKSSPSRSYNPCKGVSLYVRFRI